MVLPLSIRIPLVLKISWLNKNKTNIKNGRNKKNRGHTNPVVCTNCARLVPKDKAIKKFTVKDIVDAATRDDIQNKQLYKKMEYPKVYNKIIYCVSCAIHARVVRVRSVEERRVRHKERKIVKEKEKENESPRVYVD